MSRASLVVAFLLAAASLHAPADVLTIGNVSSPAGTITVPVYIRDSGATPLGADRPLGARIQALGFKVSFSPAAGVTSATFTRAGVLDAKTPLFEAVVQPPGGGSLGYVVSFDESSNALSFTSNAAAPGDLIGHLVLTTNLTSGVLALTIDEETAMLSNQTASITESVANAHLALQNGSITRSACVPFSSATLSLAGSARTCTGRSGGTASVAVNGGGGGHTLQWGWRSAPGGAITPIGGATGPSYTISGADFGGAGTKYLVVTATTNCAQIVSDEIPVTITEAPDVTINASSGVYASSTENFASVPDQGAGATYSWSVTNGTIASGQGTRAIRYTAGASGQVGIDVTVTASGCSGPASPHADVPIINRPAGASLLYLVTPCRVVDTRTTAPIANGATHDVLAGGVCGIPTDAVAIAANLTVVAPATHGYLALFPGGTPWPGTSTMNYRAGRTRANNAIVPLSPNGRVTVLNSGATVHYIIDVTGYFK